MQWTGPTRLIQIVATAATAAAVLVSPGVALAAVTYTFGTNLGTTCTYQPYLQDVGYNRQNGLHTINASTSVDCNHAIDTIHDNSVFHDGTQTTEFSPYPAACISCAFASATFNTTTAANGWGQIDTNVLLQAPGGKESPERWVNAPLVFGETVCLGLGSTELNCHIHDNYALLPR